jgi:hypothetical protein
MGIRKKFNNWYTRPRQGFIYGLSNWILTDPKALGIIMTMGYIVSLGLFGSLFILSLVFDLNIVAKILFFVASIVCVRNLYKYYKFKKITGSLFENDSLYDTVFNKKKVRK